MKSKTLSIIIPTRNRHEQLRACIDSIIGNHYNTSDIEIIIVDDGSSDSTCSYLQKLIFQHKNVRVLYQSNQGPASARNRGVKASSGDLVLFTDDDCTVPENWLAQITTIMQDHSLDALGGRICAAGNHLIARYMETIRGNNPALLPNGQPRYLVTANACFRRRSFDRVGGFDATFWTAGGEDTDLALRMRKMGFNLAFSPLIRVYHWYEPLCDNFLQRYYRYGVGARQIVLRNMDTVLASEAWIPNPDKELRSFLRGDIEPREFGEITNILDRLWFCLLHVFQRIAYLAGYLFVTDKDQAYHIKMQREDSLDKIPEITDFSRKNFYSKITEIILASLSRGDLVRPANKDAEMTRAYDWIEKHFQDAMQTREIRSWVKSILKVLDADLVLGLASKGIRIHSPSSPDHIVPISIQTKWAADAEERSRIFSRRRVEILLYLIAHPEFNNRGEIEELCEAERLDVDRFLSWYGYLLEDRAWGLRVCSPEERGLIEDNMHLLRTTWR